MRICSDLYIPQNRCLKTKINKKHEMLFSNVWNINFYTLNNLPMILNFSLPIRNVQKEFQNEEISELSSTPSKLRIPADECAKIVNDPWKKLVSWQMSCEKIGSMVNGSMG